MSPNQNQSSDILQHLTHKTDQQEKGKQSPTAAIFSLTLITLVMANN